MKVWKLSSCENYVGKWQELVSVRLAVIQEEMLMSVLKVRNARVKVEWVKREEQLSVTCINMMVKEKQEIRVLRGVIYMMKSRGWKIKP